MNYREKMAWYNRNYKMLYKFEPKSVWEFVKNTFFDKSVQDKVARDTLRKDLQGKRLKLTYHKDWGARTSLSKFNSEYAKRLINFFTCKGDLILDPFGGRTRKQICEMLGRKYVGFEINPEYCSEGIINDDCFNVFHYYKKREFDCLFTCPPYWNLEIYSENIKGDLSLSKNYEEFKVKLEARLHISLSLVKNNGICIIVVADFRKDNQVIPLHYDIVTMMNNYNWKIYDTVILEMNPSARECYYAQAITKRRMLTTHEYALIFSKENPNIEIRKFEEDFNKPRKSGLGEFVK